MAMPKLLVLDLDGTLVDSRRDIADSLNFALKKEGFPELPRKKIEDLVGWGAKQLVKDALGNPSEEDLMRVFLSFWNHYDAHLLDHTRPYEGVMEFLQATGDWQRAVITNKPEGFSRKIIQGLELEKYFQWVIGGDSLAVRKPDAGVLHPIRLALGNWEIGVMVGDSVVDVEFGKAAGLINCALTHGFGIQDELAAMAPDFLIKDFWELAALSLFEKNENLST
jgi:phosphoglycolate phosphatase